MSYSVYIDADELSFSIYMELLCNITLRDISDIHPAVDQRKPRVCWLPGCIWLEADVRGIYPTYLIVEEVSKTIEIINSRDVSVYIP